MKSERPSQVPVACDLNVFDSEQNIKHESLLGELLANIKATHELPNGYELNLPNNGSWYVKLAEWVSLERQCCPFLSFEQGFNQDGIWLRLTGDANAKQYLTTMMIPIIQDRHVSVFMKS